MRPRQHVRRYRENDLLRGFQTKDQLAFFGRSTGRSARLTPSRFCRRTLALVDHPIGSCHRAVMFFLFAVRLTPDTFRITAT